MKKSPAVTIGIFLFILSSLFMASCNNNDTPAEAQTSLSAEPSALTVSTGTTGLAAISGGSTPYSIKTAPNSTVATATITSYGVLTVTPVNSGSTSISIQDGSSPARTVNIPITITIGHGGFTFDWTINGDSPTLLCAQVNSQLISVTVNGYAPVTNPCGGGTISMDTVTAGTHTVVAQLLNPSSSVLSTVTETVYVAANQVTTVHANFNATLIIGTFHAAWTINNQPSGSGCENATSVRAVLGDFTPVVELCSTGHITMNYVPAGTYAFVADLLDANNTSLSHIAQNVTIGTSQTTNTSMNFTIGPIAGSATINWTINGGENCVTNGNMNIAIHGPSTVSFNTNCSTYSDLIPSLGPGTYTFDLTLTDPAHTGQQATAEVQNVTVSNNANTVVPVDVPCLFCGGTSSTGWVQAHVSCGGAACGLSGTLYVIIQDCGTGTVPLNADTLLGATLTAGTPIDNIVSNVLTGGRCVIVFLDVDGDGRISTGDAISSLGEQNVIIYGGQTSTVNVTLDSVSP